jgi:hypothetical protein
MTKHTKSKNTFATELLCWLNQEWLPNQTSDRTYGRNSRASRSRVLALVEAIRQAEQLLVKAVEKGSNRNYWENPPKRIANTVEEINEILFHYPSIPHAEIAQIDGHGGIHLEDMSSGASGCPLGEQISVWAVIRLAKQRKLSHLRKCRCNRWFLATRQDQQFCSASCRHRAYEQTEAFKVKRRDYMRRYYQLKNSGKVKA